MQDILKKYKGWDKTSTSYLKFKNRVEFRGYIVTENGLVFNKKTGRQSKPIFRWSKGQEPRIIEVFINHMWQGKNRFGSYSRFIYAAWNQDTFQLEDRDKYVVSTVGTIMERNPKNLTAISKEEYKKRIGKINTKYNQEDRDLIYNLWLQYKKDLTNNKICNILGISEVTLNRIIEENTHEHSN